jgi:hypothetical protein
MRNNPAFAKQKITVGPSGADVCGLTGSAIQIAIDALGMRGGGTVEVREGCYELIDSVRLRADVALVGRGEVTLRRSEELIESPLLRDADIGQMEIAPANLSAFRVGMGVCIADSSAWAYNNTPLTVTAIEGGRLWVHEMMYADRLAAHGARVVNYFPLVLVLRAPRCLVEGIAVSGRVSDGRSVESLWSSGVYVHCSPQCTVRRVRASGVQGDGVCVAKASLDGAVEDCETFENTHYGVHAGSHSARTSVRRCHIHHNGSDGLYICWGVDHAFFEDNDIHHNGARLWRNGFSIGHQDTDNVIARNHIYENCKYGVSIRTKTQANGAHRNVFRENVIENNGQDPAGMPEFVRKFSARERTSVGVSIMGVTEDVVFERNVIRESRPAGKNYQRNAFYVAPGVSRLSLKGNDIAAHPEAPIVDESGAKDNRLA